MHGLISWQRCKNDKTLFAVHMSYIPFVQVHWFICDTHEPYFNLQTMFLVMWIPIIKERWSHDSFIFIMGTHIVVRLYLYIEMAPWCGSWPFVWWILHLEEWMITVIDVWWSGKLGDNGGHSDIMAGNVQPHSIPYWSGSPETCGLLFRM